MSDSVALLSTSGIADRQTRNFLDRLVEAWNERSSGDSRFVTADELPTMVGDTLSQAVSGGVTGGASGTTKSSVTSAIVNLTESIRKNVLYQTLQDQISPIDLAKLRSIGTDYGASISLETTTRSSKDSALASAINRIWAYVGGSTAVIDDGTLAAATPTTATATKWTQVVAAVTDPNTGLVNAASIKQDLNTYASNVDNKFNAVYTVRAQVAYGGQTVVGGFGLSATAGAASGLGASINFGVLANQFFIAAPASGNDPATDFTVNNGMPFVVVTTPTVIGGKTFPAGTYLKKAFIGDATIDTAKITDTLQSDNFVTGTSGWFLRKSDGFFECNNIYARGNIQANSVTANTITATNIVGGSLSAGYIAYTDTGTTCSVTVVVPTGARAVVVSFDPGESNTLGYGKDVMAGTAINIGNWSVLGYTFHSQVYVFPDPTGGTYSFSATRQLAGSSPTRMALVVTVLNR